MGLEFRQAYSGNSVNTLYKRFYASGSGYLHPNNVKSALLNHINKSTDLDCTFHFEGTKSQKQEDAIRKYNLWRVSY